MKRSYARLASCAVVLILAASACRSRDWGANSENADGGGDGGKGPNGSGGSGLGGTTTGGADGSGGTGGIPTVIGDECESASECAPDDAEHCVGSCEEVDDAKRCVYRALDEDGDGHGIPECEEVPGDDCDDADPYSYPGAPAVSPIGDVRCVRTVSGTCQSQGATIEWTSTGTAILAYPDTSVGSYGAVVAQALDAEGVPTGSVTTWSASSGAVMTGGQVTLTRKDNDTSFGLLRGDTDTNGSYGLEFSEVAFGVSATMTSTEVVAEGAYNATGDLDLVRLASSWNFYGRHSYYTATLINGNATGIASELSADNGMQGVGNNTRVVGTTRGVVGVNQASYMNASYDPALVFQRYPVTGSMHTQQGSNVVLLGNSATTDIAPDYTLGSMGDNFIVFFRDSATSIPLTARVINTSGATVGSEVSFATSAILPRDILDLGDRGGILIGIIIDGSDRFLVAQRYDASLTFIGEPIELSAPLDGNPSEIETRGTGIRGSIGFSRSGRYYRTFGINACD